MASVPDHDLSRVPLGCSSLAIGDGAFCVTSASEEAIVTRPSVLTGRDGGEAGVIGPWLLWTWGDTISSVSTAADGRPVSASASLSPIAIPGYANHVEELAGGFPIQFFPHNTAERNYNDCNFKDANDPTRPSNCAALGVSPVAPKCIKPAGATATTQGVCASDSSVKCTGDKQCTSRYALWPTRPIELSSTGCSDRQSSSCVGNGLIMFNSYLVTSNWTYYWAGTGTARITEKAQVVDTTATRDANFVFTPSADKYGVAPHMVKDGYVYLGVFGGSLGNGLARVPLASVTDKTRYTYWNVPQQRWLSGQTNVTLSTSQSGRISWNPFLQRYISIYGRFYCDPNDTAPCDFDPNTKPEPNLLVDEMIQSATDITGPWSTPVSIRTTRKKVGQGRSNFNYYVVEQPDLMVNNGRQTRISYYQFASPSDIVVDKISFALLPGNLTCELMTAPATVSRGQRFAVTVKFKNIGLYPWTNTEHKLINSAGRQDEWAVGKVALPVLQVNPQGTVSITFYATAPSSFTGSLQLRPKLLGKEYPVNGACSKYINVT